MTQDNEATAKRITAEIVMKYIHPDAGCTVDEDKIEAAIAAALAERDAEFVRGLERARDLVAAHGVVAKDYLGIYPQQIIQAEIDKAGKP